MTEILELAKYIIPSIVVAGVVYGILDKFFKEENKRREFDLRLKFAENTNPQRLQAYERMALFLERIRPTYLARRVQGDSVKDFEYQLINTIQVEFEHNLSQQIYINPQTWKIIFSAKNSTQNFISECVKKLPENASVQMLQEEIIRSSISEDNPSNYAMIYLQKDIQSTNF
jgi:hypothetical protein